MTSKVVIHESESPQPAASSILILRMTSSSVIIPYRNLPTTLTDLWQTVLVRDHAHDVVQRQQTVALDLGVDVLALGTASQQLHQVDVVHERAGRVDAVMLRLHQLDQVLERGPVVVEQQHVVTDVH